MSGRNDRLARLAIRIAHAVRRGDVDLGRDGDALMLATPRMDPALTWDQIGLIHHALGHRPERPRSGGHRNHYAPSWPHDPAFDDLVDRGYLERGGRYNETHYYHVTEAGARAAGCLSAWRRHQRDA